MNYSEHNIMESKTNPEDWLKECERVSARLKIQTGGDTKEWRTHLEQAKKYGEVCIYILYALESKRVLAGNAE